MSYDQKKRPGFPAQGSAQTPRKITSIADQIPDVSRSLTPSPKEKFLAELRQKGDFKTAAWFEASGTPDHVYDVKNNGTAGLNSLSGLSRTYSADHIKKCREELLCPACFHADCSFPDSPEAAAMGWNYRIRRVVQG